MASLVSGLLFASGTLATVFDNSIHFDKRLDDASSGCNDNTFPRQIRLAYAGEDGMAVSWNTFQKLSNPTVLYGNANSEELDRSASSEVSITYPTSSTYNNHVVITGLQPDTIYNYRPACGNTTLSFSTTRKAGDGAAYSWAYIADMGTFGVDGLSTHVGKGAANPLQVGEKTTIQSLKEFSAKYDFILHAGDIAYADYWLKEEIQGYINDSVADGPKVYDRILNDFYYEVEGLSSSKAYMVGPGNHEANCDNGGTKDKAKNITYTDSICVVGQTNFTGFRNHWKMPSAQSGGLENFWYSFDNGMAHFVMINTETDYPNAVDEPGGSGDEDAGPFAPSGTQLAWLKNDLASIDRKKTPWVIVAGHRPWYVSNSVCKECQAAFESILIEGGVDLVVAGHDHLYERVAPIANGTIDPNELNNPSAPWYITNGAAGHYDGLDELGTPVIEASRKAFDTAYAWNLFTFHNCTHLSTQAIASGNGTVLDTAVLYKNRTCDFDGQNGGYGQNGTLPNNGGYGQNGALS